MSIRFPSLLFALVLLFLGCGQTPAPQTVPARAASSTAATAPVKEQVVLAVAAAADLKYALDELIVQFETRRREIHVQPTYGSSGNFYAQLTNKAPFDIYFSADLDYPRKLAAQQLTLPNSEFRYAVGQIVVWARKESSLNVEQLGIQSLLEPSIHKIAIANPQHAPYGRAAEAALKQLGVYDQVHEKLVLGENIAQTAQFIESGAADVGIIALSLALAPALKDQGKFWKVPLDAYPPLEQGGAILAWTAHTAAAEALRSFVLSPEGKQVLARYGFLLPGK
jgi:molybdate transport system substrate-binding protein